MTGEELAVYRDVSREGLRKLSTDDLHQVAAKVANIFDCGFEVSWSIGLQEWRGTFAVSQGVSIRADYRAVVIGAIESFMLGRASDDSGSRQTVWDAYHDRLATMYDQPGPQNYIAIVPADGSDLVMQSFDPRDR